MFKPGEKIDFDGLPTMLTLAMFSDCIGSTFRLFDGELGPWEIELTEVRGLNVAGSQSSGARESFALLFRGPRNVTFRQNTFRIEHAKLGTHEIFLVPVARDGKGTQLEAIFN